MQSPLLIFGVLIYFLIDIAQNPPTYRKWNMTEGSWDSDTDGSEIRYEYDAVGMSVIALLHVVCLAWSPVFLIKALFRKGSFSFSNFKYPEALIYREKAE